MNHRCLYTHIIDVGEDSDLSFFKKQQQKNSPLVKNVWVYIGAFYEYVFLESDTSRHKSATYHINQSNTVELQTCARLMCFYCFQRAPGIGLKDRMHSSRY